jgi:hypothetical protein
MKFELNDKFQNPNVKAMPNAKMKNFLTLELWILFEL